jgi:hypothetical protein
MVMLWCPSAGAQKGDVNTRTNPSPVTTRVDDRLTSTGADAGSPCADVAAAFDRMLQNLEAMFSKLKSEARGDIDALSSQAKSATTRLASAESKIAAIDAKIDALNAQLTELGKTCFGREAAFGTCSATRRTVEANRAVAIAERESFVRQRDSIKEELRVFAKDTERLEKEIGQLSEQLEKTRQALTIQKQKALAQCAKLTQPTDAAITRFCGGKGLVETSKSTVVVVGGTPGGAQAIAGVERSLGMVRTSLSALSGDAASDKAGTVKVALGQSAGKALLVDGATAFVRTTGGRVERGGYAIVGAAFDLEPRLVIVHVDGPIGETERAMAIARGWRVAPDGENGVRSVACR